MLDKRKSIFGVHSITPYRRDTLVPYGIGLVVNSGTFSVTQDIIELRGGSNKFSWQNESGDSTAELTFGQGEYPDWLFELFGGRAPTVNAADLVGTVEDLANFKGLSVVSVGGLLATVTVDDATNLKFTRYIVEASAIDAIKVYAVSNVDFSRGDIGEYTNERLVIAEFTGLVINETYALPNYGISLTTGAGPIALVPGDSAFFDVRPPNKGSRKVKIGGLTDILPEFGCYIYAEKSGSNRIVEINAFKCKSGGLTLGATRKEFASNDYTATLAYDEEKDGILEYQDID